MAYNSRGWWQKARRQGCQVRDAEAPELLNGSMHRLRHISQSFLQVLSHTVSHGAVTACAVVMVRDCRKDICVPCIVSASTSWTTRTDLTAYWHSSELLTWILQAVETLDEMMSIGMVRPLVWNLRAFSASLYGNCIVALEGFPCLSDFSFAGIWRYLENFDASW